MKRCFAIIAIVLQTILLQAQEKPDVIYRITPSQFFDSNGDGTGDLKGIQQKLGYLEQLGVTAILLSPVYESGEEGYSNDFMTVDPKVGILADYRTLVVEAHKKAMKVYQEINLQYVSTGNKWFAESYKKTSSEYRSFIYYSDDKSEKPVYLKEKNVAVNLREPKVQEYMLGVLKHWADPNKDKLFNDGVDGFVLDMADKTPGATKLVNLHRDFWQPLTDGIKAFNPKVKVMSSGDVAGIIKGSAERAYPEELQKAIATFEKNKINTTADTLFKQLLQNKSILVYAPQTDTAEKQKVAAALSFMLGGVPVIQSGQEIAGNTGPIDWGGIDGHAKDTNSVLNFYKQLIKAYKTDPGLSQGTYKEIVNSNNAVVSFTHTYKNFTTLVMINLSSIEQPVVIGEPNLKLNTAKVIVGDTEIVFPRGGRAITLSAYGVQAWRIVRGAPK